MKNWGVGLLLALLAFAATCAVASASEIEYCPARVSDTHAFTGTQAGLHSFALSAYSTRTVDATIDVQTNLGWYAFKVSNVALTSDHGRYTTGLIAFSRNAFLSPELFVRFPATVTSVSHWFVAQGQTHGDTQFGWDAKGEVACTAPAGLDAPQPFPTPTPGPHAAVQVAGTKLNLDALPAAGAVIPAAVPTTAPGDTSCARPFTYARVLNAVQAQWPSIVPPLARAERVLIMIAVSATGTVDGAWLYQPSGEYWLNRAAIKSAALSRYQGGTAFCQPAAGRYLFSVMFLPDRR